MNINDSLVNLVSRLGTDQDKAAHSHFVYTAMSREHIANMYRGSWLARKIVDIPAQDATRKWREWQATTEQTTALEHEERRLGIRKKVEQALKRASLYGGQALYIGLADDPSKPLSLDRVRKGGLQHVNVIDRDELTPVDIVDDVTSPRHGEPEYYETNNGARIHHSRLAIFRGPESQSDDDHWGDSLLESVHDAVTQAAGGSGNVASLLYEAKVDVWKIPGFMEGLQSQQYQDLVTKRVRLAAYAKGNIGALMMDAEEEYEQKELSFAGLRDLMMAFYQIASGAADIPMTRLLGQSPGGLQSTGEHDLKNYYDRISGEQELVIRPSLETLDECLIRSALGSRPVEIDYIWASLWQMSDLQRAEIGERNANTIRQLSETALIPDEALSRAAVNMMTESDVMPGLESAVKEYEEGAAI